jgi:TonB family protein
VTSRLLIAATLLAVTLGSFALPIRSHAQEAAPQAAGVTGEAGAPASTPVERMPFGPQAIRQIIQERTPEVQACYERVLADTRARLQGRVVVRFIIGLDGQVSSAKVLRRGTTLNDARVHDCVLAVRGWQFPRPSDDREHPVEYPFDLKVVK